MDQEGVFDPGLYLDAAGALPDGEIDLARTALALAILERPGISPGPYFYHLERLARETAERHALLLEGGAGDDAATRLAALKHTLGDSHGHAGDVMGEANRQDEDMIRAIDRGAGSPVTLSILYIHAARAQGWDAAGLDIPGRFVCRLEKQGQRLIFDPSDSCRVLGAADLRLFVKKALGPQAELLAAYHEPAGNREILLRLENNIKNFRIGMEDYEAALKTV